MANFDYNQNDSTASDYIKNRPFYSELSAIFDGDIDIADMEAELSLSVFTTGDENFEVTFNGETHSVTTEYVPDDYAYFAGNKFIYLELMANAFGMTVDEVLDLIGESADTFNDTGENFLLRGTKTDDAWDSTFFYTTVSDGTYSLTVNSGVIHKVSSEFIDWDGGSAPSSLPEVTSDDNGKILKVVNGAWAAGTIDLESEVAE